ncbi:universal stress protein [Raineyella fluvialis]|uniref:Universal stress protein n=1 Tax=Raineyella fluvialis TaxID=2662261 RepID=A0A5Q2FEI1_9ACTN|nr:universal stress protein [Raineyella fluvialis]QGF24791.1 universal stress protein [Raineyella fluvialis]
MTESDSRRGVVLVGVDGSPDADRALRYAVGAAELRGDDLLIAHVVDDAILAGAWGVVYDPSVLHEAGMQVVSEASDAVQAEGFPAERIRTEVVMGNATAALTKLSRTADLLVVGRRSLSGLERIFVGSTSVGVAATAHCPVVMISAASSPASTGRLQRIGVGVDATANGAAALAAAFAEASLRKVGLEVIHVWDVPGPVHRTGEHAVDVAGQAAIGGVQALLQPLQQRYPDVSVTTHVVQGHPVKEMVARSKELDLLWLGVHTTAGFGVGGVVRGVMAHAECPLALIRDRAEDTGPLDEEEIRGGQPS